MPEVTKSQQEIIDLAQTISMSLDGVEIGLAVSSLFLVIEGALSVASPAARAQCREVLRHHLAEISS